MSDEPNFYYEYQYQKVDQHPDEWDFFTMRDGKKLRPDTRLWLQEYLDGAWPEYRVRYRAVLVSDWEPYTEEMEENDGSH